MIDLRNIRFAYGDGQFSLNIPSLHVREGERVAVIGTSGCGKTTLLNILSGIVVPQEGHVEVLGKNISYMSDRDRRIMRAMAVGFIFQDANLIEYLNVFENILYPFRVGPNLKLTEAARERARVLSKFCSIDNRLKSFPNSLSGGEKQRVAVCRALVTQPKLVLADEPTGSLDPGNKDLVLDILFRRSREMQATLIMVTHDHGLLDRFDKVWNLNTLSCKK